MQPVGQLIFVLYICIDNFMKTVPPRDITASKNLLNLSCALKLDEEKGVDLVIWTGELQRVCVRTTIDETTSIAGDDSHFALPEYWDYTLDCIKKMDARETVDGIVGKLFRSAFTKYRDDIQALMVEAAQVQPSGDTAMEEDEVNFISWMEYFGRSGSWITTSELLTRIWNHLSTYGPPPLVSLDEPRFLINYVPVKKVGDPLVAQRDLRNILLLYHYFRTRSERLISQITDQMMDEEDSQGHRLRMVTEIVRLRKGFNSERHKPKWRRVKREVPVQTPFFPTLPVSTGPTKAELSQESQEQRTTRLKARKRELEYFVWERVGANDPGESFDKWLKGDTK